ncbi:MAG: MinD/ParA family protein [Thermacetogeniaceae bacterium]
MLDQAENLRLMVRSIHKKMEDELFHSLPRRCRVIAITSGKGGVGKTNIALGLAITLAKASYRVMLMDGDMGLANVDVILGMYGKYNLSHVIKGEKSLQEIIIDGPHGLKIIPGGSGIYELANADSQTLLRILKDVNILDQQMDFFFIDTGAGVSNQVMTFLLSAQEILLVTTPEPTAITDAYSLIKLYHQHHGGGQLKIIVNMIGDKQDGYLAAKRLQNAVRSFLHVELVILGYVAQDVAVQNAVSNHESYVLASPYTQASMDTIRLASELGDLPIEPPAGVKNFFSYVVSNLKSTENRANKK